MSFFVRFKGKESLFDLSWSIQKVSDWTDDVVAKLFAAIDDNPNGNIVRRIVSDLRDGTFASGSDLECAETVVGIQAFTLTPWRVQVVFLCSSGGKMFDRPMTFGSPVAAIIAFTAEDELLLIRHYRIGIGWLWELPRGMSREGEDPKAAAIREAQEELGFAGDMEMKFCGRLQTGIAPYLREHFYYTVGGLPNKLAPLDTEEEISEVRAFSLSKIRQMVKAGEITDPCVLAGLFLVET